MKKILDAIRKKVHKEKVERWLQLFVIFYIMVSGFFLTYCFLWVGLGLVLSDFIAWFLFGISIVSEALFMWWVIK